MAVQYCTFRIGGHLFGVDVARVQEIKRRSPVTPVPLAPLSVEGLVNLRGQIITAINLALRLGIEGAENWRGETMVIVNSPEGPVVLLVGVIGDVVTVRTEALEEAPPTIDPAVRPFLRGVGKLDRGLLSILDVDLVLDLGAVAAAAGADARRDG